MDPRLLRACPRQHKTQPLPELPYSIHTIENMIATELKVMIVSFFLIIISQIYIFHYITDIYFCPLQLLDRKDRKDVICPLTPSTTSSDSSSPVPSSSEEGGLEVEEVATFLPKSSLLPNNLNSGNLPGKPIIAATANKYLVF